MTLLHGIRWAMLLLGLGVACLGSGAGAKEADSSKTSPVRCEVAGKVFHVPQRYLWLGRFDHTRGCKGMISMLVQYPSMEPTDKAAWNEGREMLVSISEKGDKLYCRRGECLTWDLYKYEEEVLQLWQKELKDWPWKISERPDLGLRYFPMFLTGYQGEKIHQRDVFFRGERTRPEYWLNCTPEKPPGEIGEPLCKTEYYRGGRVYVYYLFSRSLIGNHRKIREAVDAWVSKLEGS